MNKVLYKYCNCCDRRLGRPVLIVLLTARFCHPMTVIGDGMYPVLCLNVLYIKLFSYCNFGGIQLKLYFILTANVNYILTWIRLSNMLMLITFITVLLVTFLRLLDFISLTILKVFECCLSAYRTTSLVLPIVETFSINYGDQY